MFFVTIAAYIAAFVSGILIAKLFFGEDWAIVKTRNYSLTRENKKLHATNAKLEDDVERLKKTNDSLRLMREELDVYLKSNIIKVDFE